MRQRDTKARIVQEGKSLLQLHGYHGFSFQHVAEKLGLKKPSLYDHYSTKEDLIIAIIKDYESNFDQWSESVSKLPALSQIKKVFDVFHFFSTQDGKVCPILSLAADFQNLSEIVKGEMKKFINKWLLWIERLILKGQNQGEIRKDMKADLLASLIYNLGMGAQFHARIKDDPTITLSSGKFAVDILKPLK